MKEYNLNTSSSSNNLPINITKLDKVRRFLFQELDLKRPIVLELTPGEEKFVRAIRDFFCKGIKLPKINNIFNFGDSKTE